MKSDRMLAILLLLQTRQQVPAPELAARLEVSVRTIYRDVEALSTAGIPVYAEQGRNGGIALLAGYRTDVSGLTAAEAQALFVISGRGAAEDLGRGDALRQAVRKLLSAVPSTMREDAAKLSDRILVDPYAWRRQQPAPAYLPVVQRAVLGDRVLLLRYPSRSRGADHDYRVEPYGLVVKAGIWYVVGGTAYGVRTFRLSRVIAAAETGDSMTRPPGLDLEALWAQIRGAVDGTPTACAVTLAVRRDVVGPLRRICNEQVLAPIEVGPLGADGRRRMRLEFRAIEQARLVLAGFGAGVEVLTPTDLRDAIATAAAETAALYAGLARIDVSGEEGSTR